MAKARKPMSEKAKARLRELGEQRKGRKTMVGLEKVIGLAGFDNVQERYPDLPAVQITLTGGVETYNYTAGVFQSTIIHKRNLLPETLHVSFYRWGSGDYSPRSWVRLLHCPPWVVGELVARFPSRRVVIRSYRGPTRGTVTETAVLHPVEVALEWLRFIWPRQKDWVKAVDKYVAAFSEQYVHKYAGRGSKVIIDEILSFAPNRDLPVGVELEVARWADNNLWVYPLDGDKSLLTSVRLGEGYTYRVVG